MNKLDLKGIVIIVGNCGSGKTEVSINLGLHQTTKGRQVTIADLDLVNPYFRTRDAKKFLVNHGIRVTLPPKQYLHADLPILTPVVSGMIRNTPELLILDAGGDGIGSTVLGSLSCFFEGKNVRMMHVINPNRPFNDSVEACLKINNEIETTAKIEITSIIGNANMLNTTTDKDIYDGCEFVSEVSKHLGVPICCITVPIKILSDLSLDKIKYPILPMWRQLVPPWMTPERVKE